MEFNVKVETISGEKVLNVKYGTTITQIRSLLALRKTDLLCNIHNKELPYDMTLRGAVNLKVIV